MGIASGHLPVSVYFQVLLATFLWGTAFPAAKQALSYVPPLTLAGLRFALAGLLLLAISSAVDGWRGESQVTADNRVPAHWPRVLLIGLLSTAVFYGLFFLGMDRTSASSAAVVDGAGPVVSAVMAHFVLRGDHLTQRRLLAIAVAFAGVFTIAFFRPATLHAPSRVDPIGCLLILSGLVVSSLGTMQVITYRGRLGLMRLTGCQMCFGGTLLLCAAALLERHLWAWEKMTAPAFVGRWLWLSCVSAVAFRLWYGLVRRYKLTALSVFSFLTSVWGAVLSVIFAGNQLTLQLVIGMALVISGVVIMNTDRSEYRRDPVQAADPEAKSAS